MQDINYDHAHEVAKEASKILKDYPHLKYFEAIEMAQEVFKKALSVSAEQDS